MKDHEQLIGDYLNGDLSERDVFRLRVWLLEDADQLQNFIRQTHQHGILRAELFGEEELERYVRLQELKAKSPCGEGQQTALTRMYCFFTQPTPISISVAALVVGLIVTTMAFMFPPFYRGLTQNDEPLPEERQRFVAQVTAMHEVVWATEQIGRRATLSPGQRLELESGLLEVTFRSGARVILEGPATFQIDAENVAQLAKGRLTAQVPDRAKGFAIATPSARVVDLGTEFGIEVLQDDASEIVVLEGEVECYGRDADGNDVGRVRLTKGQGASVPPDGRRLVKREKVDAPVISAYRRRTNLVTAAFPDAKFIAFHDLGGDPSWGNITTQRNASETVELVKFSDGSQTGIAFHISGAVGLDTRFVDRDGHPVTRPPNNGTPAAKLFGASRINLKDGMVHVKGGTMTFTFTGLGASQLYDIALYGDRNEGSDGVERFHLIGAAHATNASSTGVVDNFVTDLETRPNAIAGHVVRWTDIDPGADGRIEVEVATTGLNIAYLSALRVAEQLPLDAKATDGPEAVSP